MTLHCTNLAIKACHCTSKLCRHNLASTSFPEETFKFSRSSTAAATANKHKLGRCRQFKEDLNFRDRNVLRKKKFSANFFMCYLNNEGKYHVESDCERGNFTRKDQFQFAAESLLSVKRICVNLYKQL